MPTNNEQKQLSDNPREALLEISRYLNTVKMDSRYPPEADKREFTGFILSIEFVRELTRLAYEAERVAGLIAGPSTCMFPSIPRLTAQEREESL